MPPPVRRQLDSAEEVFVISDLHLGGRYGDKPEDRGFRINTHASELTNFLKDIRERATRTGRRTELVINGDFVDFLAEGGKDGTDWRAFIDDEEEAIARLDSIAGRDPSVFEAMASLLEAGVSVTLLPGNHDLELSVPSVRARLGEYLRVRRGSPFHFLYDGEAYVAGDTLIEHGNRYDGFNVVDYDVLREYRSESSRRLSQEVYFEPPIGSLLVEQVMNDIKADYGFIDLLKPENEAAIPLLIALEPSLARNIEQVLNVVDMRDEAASRDPISEARPARPSFIRGTGSTTATAVKQILTERTGADIGARLAALAAEAERQSALHSGQIASGRLGRALSFVKLVLFTKEWEDRVLLLGDSLRAVQNLHTFDLDDEPEKPYRAAAEELSREGGFGTVLFGHTHLAKDVKLSTGARYINTGTWADLMRIPSAVFETTGAEGQNALLAFAKAIKSNDFGQYVDFVPTFAFLRIGENGQTTEALLKRYETNVVGEL